jgi:hypothetical protein
MHRIRSVTHSPYRSDPSKAWIKVKDPKALAATGALDGTS